ncbi:MAG: DNA-binding response regulator [Deltaproteobacteria bacterium]|nr:MAG: DNA-binding response regulator [Deltaproteobacteria bacterium]
MGDEATIDVVVIEDDPRTLRSLVKALSCYPDIAVVGSSPSGEGGLATVAAVEPDLVLLDLELPDGNGIELTGRIRKLPANAEVLILTSFDDEVKVYQAIQAGASGYLVKRLGPERIHQAIVEVMNGGVVIEPRIARRFWNYFQSVQAGRRDEQPPLLTETERDVLQMVARGLSNQETGRVLDMERRTVRTHLAHIYRKLGTSSRSEAVVIALRRGLITL